MKTNLVKLLFRNQVARASLLAAVAASGVLAVGCSGSSDSGTSASGDVAHAVIGAQGGEIVGAKGSALDGVHLVVPAGALSKDTDITIRRTDDATPLPANAVRCGPQFSIEPAGLALAAPASLTIPFDESTVTDHLRFDDQVWIWAKDGDRWAQKRQSDSTEGEVTVSLDTTTTVAAGVNPPADTDVVRFQLHPAAKQLPCFAQYPTDPSRAPEVDVTIVRGSLNDGLFLHGRNIKPNLKFDMFTVEHSALGADGKPDPAFKSFGLAWYQSDLEANDHGGMRATIRTILLDQIFGFDPSVTLPPTGTFHVGFWFNQPEDAAACGFDTTKPTPFNGEHKAGPLAMISVPDSSTGLGPLCTKPDTSVSPAQCSP